MSHTIADMSPGEQAVIASIDPHPDAPDYHTRLTSLGLTPGTLVSMVRIAPLGDPVELRVRGFSLALRRREAAVIKVTRS